MLAHAAGDDVGHRQQIGAAVMIDDALGVACGARRVVERDRVPFVVRLQPGEFRIAFAQKIFVFDGAEPFAGAFVFRIVVIDDQRLRLAERQRIFHHVGELTIDDQHLRLAVIENERDDGGVEPCIDGVEHGSGHCDAVVRVQHCRRIGEHRRHGIAAPDAAPGERRAQFFGARKKFAVGPGPPAMNDRHLFRIDQGGAGQK